MAKLWPAGQVLTDQINALLKPFRLGCALALNMAHPSSLRTPGAGVMSSPARLRVASRQSFPRYAVPKRLSQDLGLHTN